ncbi:restriction endonuclease FokI C-terminal domain-containing protein [Clostridiaceae bacterium HSG29]|nr:restriction endonuclease FokI C-terminal domain-containing protein [Clostridiaceae bacterium HSG29]
MRGEKMKNILLKDIQIRTFGWVQNPSDFEKLKKVVQVFDHTSDFHKELKTTIIPSLIEDKDKKDDLLSALSRKPLELTYAELKGTPFRPRSSAKCNSIIQATVKGQSKEFTDDWTADGFMRWAHCLGFIDYNYYEDTFYITQLGLDFSSTTKSSEENKILIYAMLTYPPAVRILDLLSNGEHLTKFELGKKLGFNGESGFTSLPLNILLDTLFITNDGKEKNKIRSNWEGSADKYARMISKWLNKLGLVKSERKIFTTTIDGLTEQEYISHAFKITANGLKQLRRARGINKAKRIEKRVSWEMFATKKIDKVYVRTRRANILKILNSNDVVSLEFIQEKLKEIDFNENVGTIESDIVGLISIGLNIDSSSRCYKLVDTINDFIIPQKNFAPEDKSSIEEQKSEMRMHLKNVPHDFIELIEIAYEAKQNRLFEMKVMELFVSEYGFNGKHLGGSRKPDGAMYSNSLGIIVDTKAYKNGYNLPISQADEMERYVRENNERNLKLNNNEWWNIYPENVTDFKFLFVSGFFKGNFKNQLKRISISTGNYGGAISVEHLLLGAEYVKRGIISHYDIAKKFNNSEIEF